jgi:dihydroxyacetone kinase-like protein
MLDVLIPVAHYLQTATENNISLSETLENITQVAMAGMESTRDMVATKGRASYLEERSLGHIDAGARTSQLMICAIVAVLAL